MSDLNKIGAGIQLQSNIMLSAITKINKKGEKFMFDNERYITCGISDRVPEDLQVAIWSAIELQKKFCSKLDYLQVFTFQKVVDLI